MANNTQKIENLEAMMSKLIESQTMMMSMMASMQKPSGKRGASQKAESKKPTATKATKVYAPFEKSTSTFTAKAVNSKGGNPNALLQIKFNDKPSAKAIALLKAYGYRWNKNNLSWDNANTDDAKEIFVILK